jgi:DNA-binding CsgD family transcriptional regulator
MLTSVMEIVEPVVAATGGAEDCALAMQNALVQRGVSYFQARLYRRPSGRLTAARHWEAGGVLARHDPRGWVGSESSRYICFECNPLLRPVARRVSQFEVTDYAPRDDKRFGKYWEAWADGGIGTGLGAIAFSASEDIANLHVGFPEADLDEEVRQSVSIASAILAQRLLSLAAGKEPDRDGLTQREHDVMRYICDGKTDWEIGTILTVSEATARFHADNARRKLGATNRAQAVATYVANHGLI